MDPFDSSGPTHPKRSAGSAVLQRIRNARQRVGSALGTRSDLPLGRRLSLLLTLCAGATALCGFIAVLIAGVWFQQSRAISASQELARTMAYALQAPLVFEDTKTIADTLGGLSTRAQVAAAWLFDKTDRLVATYGNAGNAAPQVGGGLHTGSVVVSEGVWAGKTQLGRVVLRNGLTDLYRALAFELVAILLGCAAGLFVTLNVARRIARRITEPISALAATSGAIAADKDYSKRLSGVGGDEIGLAVQAFNRMLDEVQARDAALAESMRTLERRVTERTQELKKEKESAEAASRAKTRFLANMSHELRTPLNAVIGAAQLLDQNDANDGQRHLVEAIRTSGINLLGLIDNVLDLSRIEAGAFELAVEDFNLLDCVQGALATASVQSRAKGVAMAGVIDPSLPPWRRGDVMRLRQVLLNLLGNAVKFTPRGEVVLHVMPGTAPHALHISVRDTGIGIGQASLQQVFEPFRQADDAANRRFVGSGLGLAISRQLIEAMGGRIEVTSELGKGSVFDIWLQLPPASRVVSEPAPLNHLVAFYEPHEASAQALAAQLARLGCKSQRCTTAQDVRDWLDRLGDPAEKPWLLTAVDHDKARDFLDASKAWFDPERVIGMSAAELPAGDAAREQFNVSRSVIKPVLRAALVSRLGAPLRTGAAPAARAEKPRGITLGGNNRHVLVVEDDAMNQMIVCSMLQNAGYLTSTADDGAQALDLMSHETFDLVLMDWQMPDMDGLEVTRRLRSGAVGNFGIVVPIVALTANAFAEDRAACLAAGMNDFLTKPVLAEALIAAVTRWLGRANNAEMAPSSAFAPLY
jgi:signal transduction histidine kinase/ActR/RegA family two-component response regulator